MFEVFLEKKWLSKLAYYLVIEIQRTSLYILYIPSNFTTSKKSTNTRATLCQLWSKIIRIFSAYRKQPWTFFFELELKKGVWDKRPKLVNWNWRHTRKLKLSIHFTFRHSLYPVRVDFLSKIVLQTERICKFWRRKIVKWRELPEKFSFLLPHLYMTHTREFFSLC